MSHVLQITLLALSLLVSLLWLRGRYGGDEAVVSYNRYLADGRAAHNGIYLTSDKRMWLTINWGSAGPYDGQLVRGYHINADQSGGRPRFRYSRFEYPPTKEMIFAEGYRAATDDQPMGGWGPFRWNNFQRSGNGEEFRSITIGASHWLLFLLCVIYAIPRIIR